MGKRLTREDVLERLADVWKMINPKRGKLPEELEDILYLNLNFGKFFVDLLKCEDFTEVHAIGFGACDDEEDEADEDEEDDEE